MLVIDNPWRGGGLPDLWAGNPVWPVVDASGVSYLLERCPAHSRTPLVGAEPLARQCGVDRLLLKDERGRMGLGSFKALGAAYVIAREAGASGADGIGSALSDRVYVAASAGNHGLSVAAGARVFGASAVIYLADSVPEAFAGRLRAKGARIVRAGATYEESMAAASAAARGNGWTLLSDSSWDGYLEIPRLVMEGYLQMIAEIEDDLADPPTHIFLQAGVGGMAAAVAAFVRARWRTDPAIVVVEPEAAPALFESIRAGRLVEASGPVSSMGRLDCKVPSLIALSALARDADAFALIGEEEAADGVARLADAGIATTPSGAAGVAALCACDPRRALLGLSNEARVLAIVSEGVEAS